MTRTRWFLNLLVCLTIGALLGVLVLLAYPAGGATVQRLPRSVPAPAIDYGLYANDTENDCTLATQADMLQTWGLGGPVQLAPEIQAEWQSFGAPADDGIPVAAAMDYWQDNGINGTVASKFRLLSSPTEYTIKEAIAELGAVGATVQFPQATLVAPNTDEWTLAGAEGEPGTVAHEVALVGYDAQFVYVATWGQVYRVEWAWWLAYGTQVWVVLPSAFVVLRHSFVQIGNRSTPLREIERNFFG